MKKVLLTISCGLIFLFSSCTTENPKLTVEFKNKKGEIKQKSAIFYVSGDGRQLVIANYAMQSDKSYGDRENRVKSTDQFQIIIYLYDFKGDVNTSIDPSEYTFGDAENKSVANAQLYYFSDDKPKGEVLSGGGKTDGVKITSRNGNIIKGEINMNGRDNKSIKGNFEAKIVRK